MARSSTNGDDTERLSRAAFPAAVDTGSAEPAPDAAEQFAAHLIRKGRKSGWLATLVISGVLGTGGFFGMKAAGERRDDKIEAVETDAAAHDARPAHDGAATRVEFKALDAKVQQLDKSVGELGVKIDSQETVQSKRHEDIVEELKWLRRNR